MEIINDKHETGMCCNKPINIVDVTPLIYIIH